MKLVQQIASIIFMLAMSLGVGVAAWWLVTNKPALSKTEKPTPPATVAKPVKEDELAGITLSEEAEKRLGIAIAPVQMKNTRRVRIYGGEVTIPVGNTSIVAAPLGGTLKAPSGGMPKPGETVKRGQLVLQLLPLVTPEGRTTMAAALVESDGMVKNAETQLDASKIALDRAKRLLREEAGSKRTVDEAQAVFDLATKTLDAATARRETMAKVAGSIETGTAGPIPIDAPQDGILRTVSAFPGQTVPSGAALFEVIDFSKVWIRVPLPVADLEDISRSEDAQVGKLSDGTASKPQPAKPVAAPPSANAISATVDLFYEMANPSLTLIPGQRLGVNIPLRDAMESLTVPWSAVVFDINGGTWVYEQTSPRGFTRRRVTVRHVVGSDAVLASGPAVGTKIVVLGGQELFGAETGFSK